MIPPVRAQLFARLACDLAHGNSRLMHGYRAASMAHRSRLSEMRRDVADVAAAVELDVTESSMFVTLAVDRSD